MYENWPVGEDQISLAPAAFNVSLPKASETYLKYQDRVPQTEESEGFIAVSYTHLDVYKRQGQKPVFVAGLCQKLIGAQVKGEQLIF